MKELFELEWMGGAAEHHYRRARPGLDELPWGTLKLDDFPPSLLMAARNVWTSLAISEYRAIAAFTEIVRVLVEAKAPLDLIGMASTFVADEVTHAELASRMAMELGGALPRELDMQRFAPVRNRALGPQSAANDMVLRVCCVSEAYASATAMTTYKAIEHPLPKAIYAQILRDEAHHHRLGALYFDWAAERLDDDERARLSVALREALTGLSHLWLRRVGVVVDGRTEEGWSTSQMRQLGCLESAQMVPRGVEVARSHVLVPLAKLGIELRPEEIAKLGLDGRSPVEGGAAAAH